MPYGDVTVNLNTDNLTYGGYASPDSWFRSGQLEPECYRHRKGNR